MSTSSARRVCLMLVVQLAVLGTGMAATYDRGPLAAASAWVVGRDRERGAVARAAARADEAAQRTPVNAVRGADGQTRYAVVRAGRAPQESPRRRRERRGTRITYVLLAAIALWSAVGRLRRMRREAREELASPPDGALPHPWPDAHAGVPADRTVDAPQADTLPRSG